MTLHKKSNAIISLINQTNKTITNQNIIKSRQFILITISGGQDSLCLFFILLQLKKQWKWGLGICYCNHFWQIDSFYTNSLVFKLGLLFSIPAYLNLPSEDIFSEQKSRTWRYRQFERLNYFYNYDIIVTGHTATDRIETILLHLTRGTSTRGLSTLNWIRDLPRSEKKTKRSFTWEIESMGKQPNPLVQQLNFLATKKVINLALSSSEKSCSLRTEHKSRTNKALSVQNTNLLHKVYAKYPSKKLLFPRFVLGTNQVSLPKLPEIARLASSACIPLGKHKLGFLAPGDFTESENLIISKAYNLETSTSFKNNNSLSYNESFPIEFCSQFFLHYQLSFSKSSFFLKKKNLTPSLHKKVKSSFPKLPEVARLASSACIPLLPTLLVTKVRPPDEATTRKILYKRLDFMRSIKSYPEKARLISPTCLPIESSCLTRESNYLSKWYLRSVTLPITARVQSNFFAQTPKGFTQLSYQERSLNKASSPVNPLALQHNWKGRYYYNYNFQGNKKYKKTKACLGVISTSFIRCAPVLINYSLIFRKNFASYQANIFEEKMKFFFSLRYNHRVKLTVKPKLKCYAISNKYKYLSFSFNTVILNKRPSKILIKWLKGLYWIKLKNKFVEFEVCKFKKLSLEGQGQQLDFLVKQPDPPRRVKLAPSGLDFIWETKLNVLSKVPKLLEVARLASSACIPLYGEKYGLSLVQTFDKPFTPKEFIPCRDWQGIQPKVVNLTTNKVSSLGNGKSEFVYHSNFRINQYSFKPYFILSKHQQVAIITTLKKKNWRYIEDFNRILSTYISKANRHYKPGLSTIDNNINHYEKQKLINCYRSTFVSQECFIQDLSFDLENYNFTLNKNVAFCPDSKQKERYNLAHWPKARVIKQRQRDNLGETCFLGIAVLNKENVLERSYTSTNYSNILRLFARCPTGYDKGTVELQTLTNCHKGYLKAKIKNFRLIQPFLLDINSYQILDYVILPHYKNNNTLTKKINENTQFAIPSQKGFGWSEINKKKCFIIRPLLFITRFDLKKVCALWELPIYPDQTNERLIYFRNRIRKQLLPLLRFFFNPQIDKLFLQFTEIVNTEQLYLDTLSISLLEEFQINKRNTFELNLSTFNFIPLAIQRRLLKQFIDQYLVKKIKFFHIQILLKLLTKKKTNKSQFYDKLRFNTTLINQPDLRIQSFKSQLKANCNKKPRSQEVISEFILERKTFFLKDISRTPNQSKFFLKYYYEKTIQNKSNIYFVKPLRLLNFSTSFQYNLELSTTYGIKSKNFLQLYQSYDDQNSSFRKKLEEKKFSLEKKRLCKSQTDCLMDQSLINVERLKLFTITKQNKDIRFKLRKNLGDLDKIVKAHNLFASKNKLDIPQISLLFGVGAYFIASRRFIVLSIF